MTEQPRISEAELLPINRSLLNGVMSITLNNPERMNALSIKMMDTLSEALDDAGNSPEVRIVIIRSDSRVFCAGHDLKELTSHRSDSDGGLGFYKITMEKCSKLMQKIVLLPKPVIAEVSGTATAAGCQLVASCDLALASDSAKFCTPGVNIGLFCSTPMVALTRNVGRKQSMEMLLTGEEIDAETAQKYGLVNKVFPSGQIAMETQKYAEKISKKSALTLKIGKEAFYRQLEMPLAEAYDYCAEVMVQNMMANDAKEGINAFIEKKEPSWSDS